MFYRVNNFKKNLFLRVWHNLSNINYIFLKGLGLKLKGAHFHEPQFFYKGYHLGIL